LMRDCPAIRTRWRCGCPEAGFLLSMRRSNLMIWLNGDRI
jgi:hypothetical protein